MDVVGRTRRGRGRKGSESIVQKSEVHAVLCDMALDRCRGGMIEIIAAEARRRVRLIDPHVRARIQYEGMRIGAVLRDFQLEREVGQAGVLAIQTGRNGEVEVPRRPAWICG